MNANVQRIWRVGVLGAGILSVCLLGCKSSGTTEATNTAGSPPFLSKVSGPAPQIPTDALPPEKTGGFDGKLAYEHVAKQVGFGPRPSGSQALTQTQDYILSQLGGFGCTVETDDFTASTPAGRIPMKNIIVKIPGEKQGIILLATHYDTVKKDNFVGADDGGSSTGLMLELARNLCGKRGRYAVWIAFFDGEEAVQQWSDTDSRYGSRELAAKMGLSGDLKKVRAMLLADIVGGLVLKRELNSTKALTDLVWSTAKKLGYTNVFIDFTTSAEDDHDSFLKRGVPAVDVIGDFVESGYWHTPQDTMDKISAKQLGIVGHVFLEVVKQLQAQ